MSTHTPTEHSEFRFAMRGSATVSVRSAWERSFPVTVDGDEAQQTRYHAPSNTLLYASGGRIVTVKRAAYESWYSPHTSSCGGCSELYDPLFQGLTCPHCNYNNDDEH